MSTVRKMTPKTGKEVGVTRTMGPFTQGMEEFFENMFPRHWMETFFGPLAAKRPEWMEFEPRMGPVGVLVDLIDRDDELLVRAELPGVAKKDLRIMLAGDYLTIEATRESKEEEKAQTFYRNELGYGKLARFVYLPAEVDPQKVKATLHEGLLEITLPKVKAVKRHTIKVA